MKKRLLFFVKIAVSVGLLAVVISWIDLGDLLETYKNFDVRFFALALAVMMVQTIFSALRWKWILKADGSVVPLRFLWKTYMIGHFLGLFLPTNFGGDVYRVHALHGTSRDLAKSASSVLFDRLIGLFALISIFVVASLFLPENPYVWLILAVYLVAVAAFLIVTSDRMIARLPAAPSRWVRLPVKVLRSFNAYRRHTPALMLILGIALVFQFNIVVISKLNCLALGVDVPFGQLLAIIPLIFLIESLPISINGLGVRESAFSFFFPMIGHAAEQGFGVSLLILFLRYMRGGIGGLLLLANIIQSKSAAHTMKST